MMKKWKWREIFIIALAIVPFIFVAVVYSQLPAEVPTHWGINGEIDAYGPKWMQFVLSGIGLFVYGLLLVVPKIDPKRANIAKFADKYEWLRLGFQLFFSALIIVTTFVALGWNVDVGMIVKLGVSLLFIFIGNYMGKMKQNYMIGVKTPWTLADEDVWNRTHRVTGYVWVMLGSVMAICAFWNTWFTGIIFIGAVFLMVVIPLVYSYVIFKQKQ